MDKNGAGVKWFIIVTSLWPKEGDVAGMKNSIKVWRECFHDCQSFNQLSWSGTIVRASTSSRGLLLVAGTPVLFVPKLFLSFLFVRGQRYPLSSRAPRNH